MSAARDETAVLEALRAAGAPLQAVRFTDNRRVMISAARDGATLRLHRCFAEAPDPVLRAVGRLLSARTRLARDAARATVRDFLASRSATPVIPRARRARRPRPSDRLHVERLRAEFDRVNREHFRGALPAIPIFLSDRMRRRNGHFSAAPLEIVISRRLCTDALPGEAEQTLRHEMIHLWQHRQGQRPGHGADFRARARRLDVHPRATRPVRWGTE